MADQETVAAAVEPVVAALGLDLYDVEATGPHRARTVRVTVDRAGGVDLDTIAAASQALSTVLDADPAVQRACPGPYTLEVTSPGLERRLRTPTHFQRAVGSTVSVKTRADGAGLRRRGVLVAADGDGIEVEFDTGPERLGYDAVSQARTVFEWGAPAKPGRRRARQVASR
ncbi:MAG TPA: ribosome maturation factor RimP [Acidimicrobiia bacterium]|jgi:ribosome maturation factor RimP|nr:ribosome maturation factor RimP [Acidimicrobiia bacterium]